VKDLKDEKKVPLTFEQERQAAHNKLRESLGLEPEEITTTRNDDNEEGTTRQ
jgi:hypothetical protein